MAHDFQSNIYPGAVCTGPKGCGKKWEQHAQATRLKSPDGSCSYEQDILGWPCFICGEEIEAHTYREPTFFESVNGVGVGDAPAFTVIRPSDLGGPRKYRGGPRMRR